MFIYFICISFKKRAKLTHKNAETRINTGFEALFRLFKTDKNGLKTDKKLTKTCQN